MRSTSLYVEWVNCLPHHTKVFIYAKSKGTPPVGCMLSEVVSAGAGARHALALPVGWESVLGFEPRRFVVAGGSRSSMPP